MIAGLKPYAPMKDSGITWLGQVPAHWEVRKLKYAVSFSGGGTPSKSEPAFWNGPIPWVSPKDMRRTRITDATDHISHEALEATTARLVPPGAVLLVVRSGILQRTIPVAINEVEVALNQDMKALRPRPGLMGEFLCAVVQGNDGKLIAEWTKQGATVESIEHELLANSRIAVPPLPEQAAIVRFLEHLDKRARRYVSAKQKLVKLLEEQKQALIQRTVTCGLDPNVRLKPSGVEWLGDVPEHWNVAALRHRYSQVLGKMLDTRRITGTHSLPYLRNTDVQWDRINIQDLPTMDIPPAQYARYTVQHGDLLVCEGGEVGRCAIWSGGSGVYGFQKALHRLRPLNAARDVPRFMYYALRAAANSKAFDDGHLSTIAHLTGDKLRVHRFAFPPVGEQESLVRFLDTELKKVGRAISTALREISLLHEYRGRLIADVATGKLDVLEASAALPDEPEPMSLAETEPDREEEEGDVTEVPEEIEA